MKYLNKSIRTAAFASSIGFTLLSAKAVEIDLSEAEGFNLITWSDAVLKNSDTEGRVAVGGNATFGSYSIGNSSLLDNPLTASLVVGGNLDASGGGQVYHGSVYTGGTYSSPGYNINSAIGSVLQEGLGKTGVPFDFASAQASLTGKSTTWGGFSANGSSNELWSTLTLEGFEAGLNIFNIDAATLDLARTLEILVPTGARALINVSGSIVEFSNKGITGSHDATGTLFNFFEASELNMVGIGVTGSILAPLADLNFTSGQVDGQVIVNSFDGASWGSGELHNVLFNGERTLVPDSGSTLVLSTIAIAGLLAFKRRRRDHLSPSAT